MHVGLHTRKLTSVVDRRWLELGFLINLTRFGSQCFWCMLTFGHKHVAFERLGLLRAGSTG